MLLNRKIQYNYHIHKTLEVGMVLKGTEVRTLRMRKGSIVGAYIVVRSEGLLLMNMDIPIYTHAIVNHEPRAVRTLLAHKKEIRFLRGKLQEKGLTLIPKSLYFNKFGLVKMEIALCSGKNQFDKRQSIKKREIEREKMSWRKSVMI